MSLATIQPNGLTRYDAVPAAPMSMATGYALADIHDMAKSVSASGMFPGIKSPDQAYTLMLICDADSLHPMMALRRFHFFDGKLATRAEWALAEFQRRGGRIRWIEASSTKCTAHFSHATYDKEGFQHSVKIEDFKHLLGKDNWKNNPGAMLRARCQTQGIKMIDPGVFAGVPVAHEIEDIAVNSDDPGGLVQKILENPTPKALPTNPAAPQPADDVPVLGQRTPGHDGRGYLDVAKGAAAEASSQSGVSFTAPMCHNAVAKALLQSGVTATKPADSKEALKLIVDELYPKHRQAVRDAINTFFKDQIAAAKKAMKEAEPPAEPAATEAPASQDTDFEGTFDLNSQGREPGSDG